MDDRCDVEHIEQKLLGLTIDTKVANQKYSSISNKRQLSRPDNNLRRVKIKSVSFDLH